MRRGISCLMILLLFVALCPKIQAAELGEGTKSAVLLDIATGTVLFEKNAHEALPPASVTKVMTLLLIMEAIDGGQIGWDDIVTASEAAAAKGGSQIYLKAGEQLTVSDMVKSIAVSSANDCACAMAEHLAGSEGTFAEKMNQRAAELGMMDSHFVNCTGLDDDDSAKEHRTSAMDIAIMSRELLKNHPDITKYTTIWMDTVRNGAFGLSNTNKLIRFYPGATGLKTGFTRQAMYCLSASAEREGLGLIAVVMGCETSQKRFAACKGLLDYGFANYALYTPVCPEAAVPVKLGTAESVEAVPGSETPMLIEKARKAGMTTEVMLEETVTAPVSQGQRLGELTVLEGGEVITRIPLVAKTTIPRLTFGELYRAILQLACSAGG